MGKELFDEGDDLVSAQVDTLFGLRVNEKDGAIDLSFSDESTAMKGDEFNELRGSIPGVEDDRGER